jgi:hypothetical protein
MSIPCEQAVTIAKIETTLDHVVTLLEKHEVREDRMLDAMEVVAAQTEAIKYNTDSISRHDIAIDEIFHLLREKKSPAIQIWESGIGVYLIGIILSNFVLSVYVHWDLVDSIHKWFNN